MARKEQHWHLRRLSLEQRNKGSLVLSKHQAAPYEEEIDWVLPGQEQQIVNAMSGKIVGVEQHGQCFSATRPQPEQLIKQAVRGGWRCRRVWRRQKHPEQQ